MPHLIEQVESRPTIDIFEHKKSKSALIVIEYAKRFYEFWNFGHQRYLKFNTYI